MNRGLKIIFSVLLILFVVLALCYVFNGSGLVRKASGKNAAIVSPADSVVAEQGGPAWMELPAKWRSRAL